MFRSSLVLVLLASLVLVLTGCRPLTFTVGVGSDLQPLEETVVESEADSRNNKVAIIDISGMIINGQRGNILQSGENPVSLLHEKLRAAREDDDVKAVILRLNTPGGGVTASDVMHQEVLRFKQQTGKPVVAMAMDLTASGGYYLACASDYFIAQPTSVVGSIGVIVQTISLKPALTRWGVETESITSGPNKTTGSLLDTMTPEQRAVLQSLVDDFYARFRGIVRQARPGIAEENFAMVTDGRVFSGEKALELGLVDEVGGLYDAFAKAKSLAGIERAQLVIYHRKVKYVGSPYAAAPMPGSDGVGTQINLAQVNIDGSLGGANPPVGFYYLWTGQ